MLPASLQVHWRVQWLRWRSLHTVDTLHPCLRQPLHAALFCTALAAPATVADTYTCECMQIYCTCTLELKKGAVFRNVLQVHVTSQILLRQLVWLVHVEMISHAKLVMM